jgi:hypothetical protein
VVQQNKTIIGLKWDVGYQISNTMFYCSSKVLPLEKPVETAMLTSLTGIKCILGNQWHCTLAENAAKLNITMKGMSNCYMKCKDMIISIYLI